MRSSIPRGALKIAYLCEVPRVNFVEPTGKGKRVGQERK